MAAKYPAIPEPTNDATQLRLSTLALKQAFEMLTGVRGTDPSVVRATESEIVAANTGIATNTKNIATNTTNIATNTTNIATNTTNIATNTANIATNTTNIATNTTTLNAIQSAWTAYTPSVAVTGGSGTATGRYQQIGKTVLLQLDFQCTASGTLATLGLPAGLTPKVAFPGYFIFGRENAVNGLFWAGIVGYPSSSVLGLLRGDNTNTVTTGWRITLTGLYETT